MKINLSIEILPFPVPPYVAVKTKQGFRHEGIVPAPLIAICDLDDETLNTLCDDFKASVLKIKDDNRTRLIRLEDDTY
jgi:hypothetical protein